MLQFVQSDDSSLQEWALTMNDKFASRMDDAKYDGVAAIRDCALMFLKHHKVGCFLPVYTHFM